MNACVTGQPNPVFTISKKDNEEGLTKKVAEINVKIKPGQNKFRVEEGYMPKIFLKSEPENGKANAELVSKMEEITGEKPGIISGHKSRRKKLKFQKTEEEIRNALGEVSG